MRDRHIEGVYSTLGLRRTGIQETFNTFKKVLTKYNSEHKPPRREFTPTPNPTPKPNPTPTPNQHRDTVLKITDVVFGGSDRNGNILIPFGGTIYNSVQYIKPKLVVGSNYYGTHDVEFSLHYSNGDHDTYTDTVTFNGKGDYITSGWGAESGMVYRDCDYVDYTIRINHRVVWECRVNIARDKSIPTVPTITKMLFASTDYDGNIMMDASDSLPTGILYLTPYITVSNNFRGNVDLTVRMRRGDGRTSEYETTLKVNGAGDYYIIGWGNKEGTLYLDADTITVDLIHKGKVLFSSKVRITASARKYRRNINSSGESGWQRFNNWVEDVGDWFELGSPELIGPLLHVISLIVYITYIVMAWNDNGFWGALLTGVIGMFLLGIAYYVNVVLAKIVQWVFRFIFYNVWTLIASLIIGLLCLLAPSMMNIVDISSRDKVEAAPVEQVVQTTTYYCISKSGLKVRNAPSTSAPQLGSLVYGEAVEVIQIVGEFAKIKYEQAEKEYAWVSRNYISRTMPSQPATPKANAISITSVKFANSDYNGYNMTNYGVQLYSAASARDNYSARGGDINIRYQLICALCGVRSYECLCKTDAV